MLANSDDCFPKISIITVTYNAEEQLQKTVNSVINQTYKNIEFIIIDGTSSDNTIEILKKFNASIDYWVSEPDSGIYDAMNKGLTAATGDYVQFLNAGDYFFNEESLKTIIKAAKTQHDVIYGDIMLVDADGVSSQHHKAMDFTLDNLKMFGTGVLCHQSMLVRRDIAPIYNTKYRYKGELNWYFDICLQNPELRYFHCKKPLIYYFLGGFGYKNFLSNRLDWYKLLYIRFGLRSIINRQFLSFICNDFQNRYPLLRKTNKIFGTFT